MSAQAARSWCRPRGWPDGAKLDALVARFRLETGPGQEPLSVGDRAATSHAHLNGSFAKRRPPPTGRPHETPITRGRPWATPMPPQLA